MGNATELLLSRTDKTVDYCFAKEKDLAVYRLHQNVFARVLIGESSIVYEPAFKPCTDYVILLEVKRHNLCKSSYAVPHSITLIIP